MQRRPVPFIGVYDVFSAIVAGGFFDSVFVSGFGMSASHYGLPDRGYITWTDMLGFVTRLQAVLPGHRILVDVEDGFGDIELACHVVRRLERAGAWGVVLEDQSRPRKCGHLKGKTLCPVSDYIEKLKAVKECTETVKVVARTDAQEPGEVLERGAAFADAGADYVLADAIDDISRLANFAKSVNSPLAYNVIKGGKSLNLGFLQLDELGVSLVIYSTPCLFAAQAAIEAQMKKLLEDGGMLGENTPGDVGLADCAALLDDNFSALRKADRIQSAIEGPLLYRGMTGDDS